MQRAEIRSSLFVQFYPDAWSYYFNLGDLNSLMQIGEHRELGREAFDCAERFFPFTGRKLDVSQRDSIPSKVQMRAADLCIMPTSASASTTCSRR